MPRTWNNFTYEGQVLIDLSIIKNTNSITLNVDGLIIHKINTTLLNSQHNCLAILSQIFDEEKQFFIIRFTNDLGIGNYSLYLKFNGEIRDDVFGFYRSNYKDGDKIKWIAVTQFSPIFARRAFPCFDEPYLKATFKLGIGHYGNQTITSNTQREKIQLIRHEDDDWNGKNGKL
ncbi:hypothetical protein PV327_001749 [Microctonus hyperodae]|uniref:Aminopeptidase N-like N-terminal domain-containing protein n=1 Tax=Microctonus hyperodae TaxID=165561 RepID=A0AA39FE47_MICHY|nr:hypothetical protein PV327_001749 [Microctonus hyperodae]